MTYQVLARKWRPRVFEEIVGQPHVVTALVNALESKRLHHAYLFTGTRGVGKTTLARILAKGLNCETNGITSKPCGKCRACTEIDAGRFVDLLEVDAATNTKVDEMRELLDTAQYMPVAGRFKVYIIDEVHMLSRHAFNSMLKTLEEPPEHVKFILATTDPQRLPVTVLSRCLQFNLKPLTPALISGHLRKVLAAEGVAFEDGALSQLAKAAAGSLRDSLSLLDQAIAHGAGRVASAQVAEMLGSLGADLIWPLLEKIVEGDGKATVQEAERIAGRSLSFDSALEELASILHRIALAQAGAGPASDEPMRRESRRWRAASTRAVSRSCTRSRCWAGAIYRLRPTSSPDLRWRCCACCRSRNPARNTIPRETPRHPPDRSRGNPLPPQLLLPRRWRPRPSRLPRPRQPLRNPAWLSTETGARSSSA
jgi:DNA polymerase-3 subunit gamma/tau